MFFPRLRRQAKWMFVFLALVFGLGYVIFNVGGTIPGTGVADLLRGDATSASNRPSVGESRERIADNPNDARAYLDLSEALRLEGRVQEAIAPLERYVRMRPRDVEAHHTLASLYTEELQTLQTEAQIAQIESQINSIESVFSPQFTDAQGQPAPEDPITTAISAESNERLSRAYDAVGDMARKTMRTYKQIAKLDPADANVQLSLAQTAEAAGDTKAAAAAYERFLKLVPDDPSAPLVRERLKQLRTASVAPLGG